MPLIAKRGGARLVIINRDETPLDDLADLLIRGQAGPLMAAILEETRRRMEIARA
jgi:NAD-dependent deacetylase